MSRRLSVALAITDLAFVAAWAAAFRPRLICDLAIQPEAA
jgi:hypothetical protein